MDKIKALKKLIKKMLKQDKEASYYTMYGEGYKKGRIEVIEEILKLLKED